MKEERKKHPNHPEPPPMRTIHEDVTATLPAIVFLVVLVVGILGGLYFTSLSPAVQSVVTSSGC